MLRSSFFSVHLCLSLVSLLWSFSAWSTTVLTSIKPIQMITLELTKNVTEPDVLLASNTSPHDYSLRPSDIKKIKAADLLIWYGHDLEPFLSKTIETHENVLEISRVIPTLAADPHHDAHFWLGVDLVKQVAIAIEARLSSMDPKHTEQYRTNLHNFLVSLESMDKKIAAQLISINQYGYYVFHDAYGHFERRYHLNHLGHFTVNPDRKPGAKSLIKIKTSLMTDDVKCVFTEPQFTPAVINAITRDSQVKKGVLDPLGTDIELKEGSYFEFLNQLSNHFYECLSQ